MGRSSTRVRGEISSISHPTPRIQRPGLHTVNKVNPMAVGTTCHVDQGLGHTNKTHVNDGNMGTRDMIAAAISCLDCVSTQWEVDVLLVLLFRLQRLFVLQDTKTRLNATATISRNALPWSVAV